MSNNEESEQEKRNSFFQLRISDRTKDGAEKLSKKERTLLNEEITLLIKKTIHMSRFDPNDY